MSRPAFSSVPGHPRERWLLWGLVIGAALIRLAFVAVALRNGPLDDPDNYLPLARSLVAGEGFSLNGHPTAYRPPLYPILLAPAVVAAPGNPSLGVGAIHVFLGAATVWLTAFTARRWGLGSKGALLAAFIVAFDPVLVAQSKSVMTETLAAALAAASLAGLSSPSRFAPCAGGLAFGLGALCRPAALPVAAATALLGLFSRQPGIWRRLRRSFLLLAVTGVMVLPWAARNALVFGEPIVTTTHGGYTLALANNDTYYDEVVLGPPGAVWTGDNQWKWWDLMNQSNAGLAEPVADRRMRGHALEVIRRRPRDFGWASLARIRRFWGVSPAAAVYPWPLRLATVAWTVPLWIALVIGFFQKATWSWPRLAAPATLITLSAIHSFYWTDMRMRSSIVPAIALIAASGALPPARRALRNAARE